MHLNRKETPGNHRLKGVSDNVMFDKRVMQIVASPPGGVCTPEIRKTRHQRVTPRLYLSARGMQ